MSKALPILSSGAGGPAMDGPPGEQKAALGIPVVLWLVLGILALLALLSPNPGIGLMGVAVAAGMTLLLWRPGEPQALLFILGFQWLQSFAPVLLALLEGEPIANLMGGLEFETATILTMGALAVYAVGLKVGTRGQIALNPKVLLTGLESLNRHRLFMAWIVLSMLSMALALLGSALPTLRQGMIAIDIWKWAVVLLVFFRWLACGGEGGLGMAVILGVETVVGMMGYFSAFKEVFFILLLAGSGALALGRGRTGPMIAIAAGLLVFAGFWQAIKVQYRDFLSQGEREQVVNVSIPERVAWLSMALQQVDREALTGGLEDGLRRLGYIEFFGHCLRTVPAVIPHSRGELWKEAVLHPLMPRLLFPNKPVINDSDRTNAFSGIRVADAEEGTSISIGYVGESYIDFGRWGMMVPIFLWGWLIGGCFKFLSRRGPHLLLGTALASCLLLSTVMLLESSNIKMTGSLIAGFLVTAVLLHFFGQGAWDWLTGGPAPDFQKRLQSKNMDENLSAPL